MMFRASQLVIVASDRALTGTTADYFAVLNHMTGDDLYVHQLPRAADWARRFLIELFPWIEDAANAVEAVDWSALTRDERVEAAKQLIEIVDRSYGEVDVPSFDGEWVHLDALDELVAIRRAGQEGK